jgi:GNAT superfamily N-acetyltransferase
MALRALARDFGCLIRREGVAGTLRKATGAFARTELLVLVKPLDAIAPIAFAPRLELSELGPAALPQLAELNRRRCDTRATDRFADDLARGYTGFVAHDDGQLAGYYWWTDGGHRHLDRLDVTLAGGDVYGFDFFVAQEHRGDGRAVEFLYAVETALRARGFERVWGYVRADNRPARWLYSSRGYEIVKSVHLRAP